MGNLQFRPILISARESWYNYAMTIKKPLSKPAADAPEAATAPAAGGAAIADRFKLDLQDANAKKVVQHRAAAKRQQRGGCHRDERTARDAKQCRMRHSVDCFSCRHGLLPFLTVGHILYYAIFPVNPEFPHIRPRVKQAKQQRTQRNAKSLWSLRSLRLKTTR